jgi:hypothetical protein
MMNGETVVQKLSFYGRLVDEIAREVIPFKNFKVSIKEPGSMPIYKEDGYFVFSDLEAPADYQLHLSAHLYQSRSITKHLPAGSPTALSYPGEDELYVIINEIQNGTEKRVLFNSIAFLKTIPEGSLVYKESGGSTRLAGSLEGENVGFAVLEDISGLAQGEILRFVRSSNIIMRPGPYFPFDAQTTLIAMKFVDNSSPSMPPIAGVKCEIKAVNGEPVNPTPVEGLEVWTVTLPDPVGEMILGSENDIITYSNERGDSIFYYPGDTPIDTLSVEITAAGYNPDTRDLTVVQKQRAFYPIELTKV